MLKKSLAWVLTLAMLLGTLSGLALITSASDAKFALASYISGEPLYKNAEKNLDTVTEHGGSTPMEGITGNEEDRYAYFMTMQNDQLGITIPSGSGIGANATIEVKFWASSNNKSNSRMGLNFSTNSHNEPNGTNTNYSWVTMSGANGAEKVALDNNVADAVDSVAVVMADGSTVLEDEGWKVLKLEVNDAAFASGGKVNIVFWSSDNSDDTKEGWYVQSILVYDTVLGRPTEAEIGIREDIIGYYDFTEEPSKDIVLSAVGGEDVADVDGLPAKKLTSADGYKLTVESLPVNQPAVLAEDVAVTIMAEVKEGDDGEWKVVRADLRNQNTTTFEFGTLLFADAVEADTIYVRKVVVAQTALIVKNEYDYAFIDLDEPYSDYNDFQRVTKTSYMATYGYEAPGDNPNATLTIDDVSGRTAATAAGGYFMVNVDDAYVTHAGEPVADLRIDVTYYDKGEGALKIQYNQQANENGVANAFAELKLADLTNSGEWKTATVYLSDAAFENKANGADFRIPMGDLSESAISAVTVTVGADKAELTKWVNKALNQFKYTAATVSAFLSAQSAATSVLNNTYATAAEVRAQVENIRAKYEALELSDDVDTRFVLSDGAIWAGASKDGAGNVIVTTDNSTDNGSIVKVDGWYCWAFPSGTSGRYIGLALEDEDLFADSTSVTYEYDVKFDTTCGNDRVFMGFGSNTYGWTSVNDKTNQPNFNGYQAAGSWAPTPAIGKWGTITMVNGDFSNDYTSSVITGAITTLGAWIDNDDKEANFYVRAIRVYDTNDKSKMVSLEFKEDVTELLVTPSDSSMTLSENNGYDSYLLDGSGKSLNISTKEPIADGIVSKGENKVLVAVEYYLTNSDNESEKLTLTYGDGKVAEISHSDLTIRNNWIRTSFKLTDANFGSVENLVLNYEGDGELYIRGIRLYAYGADADGNTVMTSEKAAKWGNALLDQDAMDHAYYDWSTEAEESYGMTVKFDEGDGPAYQTEGDRRAVLFTNDKLYVTVDDSVVDDSVRYVRVDITHEEGSTLYIEYNTVLPEGVDDSAEPYLSMYRFRASGDNKELKEVEDAQTGEKKESYAWITTEDDFVNPIGVIKPTSDSADIEWLTTSIYLSETQFRGAANGADFRIISVGMTFISNVTVYAITEEEYNAAKAAVGDQTALKAAYEAAAEKYANTSSTKIQEALEAAEYFITYNYRASQADVDTALAALNAALSGTLGDVNGDGKVNTADARLTLQYAAGRIKDDALDLNQADVDGNGKVNTADARIILQRAANRITKFPIE